ncbi:LOW QUALITY PROTEIN: leucine-rich repeat-containing protein 37A3-like [Nannospalax galili]|uniref:LOW QUALITY PROTEIN: leucine-rich repeat-containing protein 37A3-like n=1 Tax=Nannospalax galili TaxID=1026970 RepID=UPI00111C2B89|nr:LOW QUALITY PROTEIN: leucine-rich repeat-containing protein 37A3-like [Nannospalax galili]
MSLPRVVTPLGFHFCAPELLLTGQLLLVVTQADHFKEWVSNPLQLISESWVPTKLWSWHPSDHPIKSPHALTSQADATDFDYPASSASSQMSPPQELENSFLPFQDTDTSEEWPPKPHQFTVSQQDLDSKWTPGKLPENILKLNEGQNKAPLLPPQFKSISLVDQAADHQLYKILVPQLDRQNSKAVTFIPLPPNLKKPLAQHRRLAKLIDETPNQSQLQRQTEEEDCGDPSINEAYSYDEPLQSQKITGEPPDQIEPSEFQQETQTQNPENPEVGQSSSPQEEVAEELLVPSEDKPSVEKEGPNQHQLASEEAALGHAEINSPSPNRKEAQHSSLPNVTVKPVDLEVTVISEAEKETQPTLSQQQAPAQLPESPEDLGPSLTKLEAPAQLSESPEDIASSSTQIEAPAPTPELSEELEPSSTEQEPPAPTPELSEESEASSVQQESPDHILELLEDLETGSQLEVPALPTSQNEIHYNLPNTTVRPVDVVLTISPEPTKEVESSLTQHESPEHPLEYPEEVESFFSEQEMPAQASESPGENQPPGSQLEIPTQASEYALNQQEQLVQSPEHHEITISHAGHHQARPSDVSSMTLRPPDMQLTITPEPTAKVQTFPVHHEATGSPITVPINDIEPFKTQHDNPTLTPEPPEEVGPLAVQQETPAQSPTPISYEKPSLSQQEATENSQILEDIEHSPAQQEAPAQPPEFPNVVVAQPPEQHEVTVSPLDQIQPPVTHNITAKPPDSITEGEPLRTRTRVTISHPGTVIEASHSEVTITNEARVQPLELEFGTTTQINPNVIISTNICELCICENETLLCDHLSSVWRLHHVPVPEPRTYNGTFTILNFQGNLISYIDKNVWKAYRWAEKLILSENRLTELYKESFEGLLSLQYLDLSWNKIQYIERRTFESLPFLKYINLGCSVLSELSFGTFQEWHGMQFLQKL